MESLEIRSATAEDATELTALYQTVASREGGLARTREEIGTDYVTAFLTGSLTGGASFVAVCGTEIVGEIHVYAPGPKAFAHVLGELTVAVHPAFQGRGVGTALFQALLNYIERHRPDILRVELIARESNVRAIALYERLGFVREGRLEHRIASVGGGYEADIPMAWRRGAEKERGQ